LIELADEFHGDLMRLDQAIVAQLSNWKRRSLTCKTVEAFMPRSLLAHIAKLGKLETCHYDKRRLPRIKLRTEMGADADGIVFLAYGKTGRQTKQRPSYARFGGLLEIALHFSP
jgi:hypothetical protein